MVLLINDLTGYGKQEKGEHRNIGFKIRGHQGERECSDSGVASLG